MSTSFLLLPKSPFDESSRMPAKTQCFGNEGKTRCRKCWLTACFEMLFKQSESDNLFPLFFQCAWSEDIAIETDT